MNNKEHVAIIGGGIIGLCTAYYLDQSGFKVTLIDQEDLESGCSVGNAGMIVPSHFIPLAQPGMISKGIRWMFDSKSPFYINPRLSSDLIRWGWQFYRSANREHVKQAMPLLKNLNLRSKTLYEALHEDLKGFELNKRGLVMYCKTTKGFDEEIKVAKAAHQIGLEAQILDAGQAQDLDKGVEVDVKGAVYFPEDAFLSPQQLINRLVTHLRSRGVTMMSHTAVTGIATSSRQVSALTTNKGKVTADQFVLAAGSWSAAFNKSLQLNLLMQAGKGYSFTISEPKQMPAICAILTEAKVAVTPMHHELRFAGTMEIGPPNATINQNRVAGIKESISHYFPFYTSHQLGKKEVWSGLRPCSPDGLPYIGRPRKYDNLIVATGHGMMGISMGPVTGELVSKIASGAETGHHLNGLSVDRFD